MFVSDAPARALTVLVVDDDPTLRDCLARAVGAEGWTALTATDGLTALQVLRDHPVDAVLLDVGLPFVDGLETCRRLRAAGNPVPVLVLSGRDAVDDRVAGLEAGADDYLVKPFALREVLARIRAITRRVAAPADAAPAERRVADLRIDLAAHQAFRGDRLLALTRTEFLLLDQLAAHAGRVLERSQLLLRVWGYDFGAESNSLGVYVGYLRRKTEEAGEPRLIHTVRNVGYVLREAP
jgi:two-component system, OmpR family, response regulator MprA